MSDECNYCGADVAEGWAWVNDLRFCHSDDLIANCYQNYLWAVESDDWLEWIDSQEAWSEEEVLEPPVPAVPTGDYHEDL